MTLFDRHLDDSTLRLLGLDHEASTPGQAAHLRSCSRCRTRHTELARSLDVLRLDADAAADACFSGADLERQRRSILQRLTRGARAARVLPFPGHESTPVAPRADRRWLVASAAAGLVLGALAGQLPHLLRATTAPAAQAPALAVAVVQPAATPAPAARLADDTLLSEVDAALDTAPRSELAALDALTPVHYEIR